MKQLLTTLLVTISLTALAYGSALIDAITSPDIAQLKAPMASDAVSLYEMDIESTSPECYASIQQGFGHLLSLWDLQAYRFFVEALRNQEDSVMATSGLTLALNIGDIHLRPQADMSIVRLRELLKGNSGTQFEREFGFAVLKLISRNKEGWLNSLSTIVERKDIGWKMAGILHAFYMRDGYNANGEPKANQRKTIETLTQYCEESPEDPASLVFYITAQMDDPNLDAAFIDEILANAKKLVKLHPNFPSYRKLLAYCLLRAGDPFLAASSYELAYTQYYEFITAENIPSRNCLDLINTQIGYISALILQENYTEANKATARLVASPKDVGSSPTLVDSAIVWEGESFPLRIALLSGKKDLITEQIGAMEEKLATTPVENWPPNLHFYNSLLIYAQSRLLILTGETGELTENIGKLKESNKTLYESYEKAATANAVVYWNRAMNLAYILHHELKARNEMAKAQPELNIFLNHISSAIEEQRYYAQFSPPLWLEPIQNLKAAFLISTENYDKALEALDESYLKIPNHLQTLYKLEEVLLKLDRGGDATEVAEVIKNFKSKQSKE